MQDMIKKIVDMDEKAQEITEEAKRPCPPRKSRRQKNESARII